MQALGKVRNVLSAAEMKSLVLVLALMLAGMVFEMLGIGIILPIFAVITAPEKILNYPGGADLFAKIGDLNQSDLVIYSLLIIAVFSVIKFFVLMALSYLQSKTTYDILAGVSSRLYQSYLEAPYVFHLNSNSSQLIRNATLEVQIFAQNLINPTLTLLAEILVTLGVISVLLALNPKGTGLAMLFIGLLGLIFIRLTRQLSRRWGVARQYHEGKRIKIIQEGLSCVKEIVLLDKTKFYAQNYEKEAILSATVAGRQVFMGQLPRLMLELIAALAICLIVWVNLKDGIDLAEILPFLVMFAAAAFRVLPSVNRILGAVNAIFYSYPSVKALISPPQNSDAESMRIQDGGRQNLEAFEAFEFKDLEFSYSESSGKAISGISLSFHKGEMIGFVGETGSGKSTLLDLMLGLLKPTAGQTFVNGQPMQTQLPDWRKKIGYVPQTIALVDDTIRKNIAFGLSDSDIDDLKVASALKIAQLDDFIKNLPEGVQTLVGERGVRISGGQRQRIGIARALYHQPEIIFFDEATSALDNQTEAELMQSIEALHGNVTLVMIAHRLSSIMNCDRVYRLKNGRIIEQGVPAAILKEGA